MKTILCPAAICFGAVATTAFAHVVSIVSVADNTLVEDATGSLSNGAGTTMIAGKNGMNLVRRALVRFDIAGAVPAGATVTSASLRLFNASGTSGSFTLELRRAGASWGEGGSVATSGGGNGAPAQPGDATWLHRFWPDVLWSQPGGEFSSTVSATVDVEFDADVIFGSSQFVADVQHFLDVPQGNFGWLIKGDETQTRSVKRFPTREEPAEAGRPTLLIQYATCEADLNGDAIVDDADFSIFVVAYALLDCGDATMPEGCPADLNGDDIVDDADFSEFVVAYDAMLCG